MNEAIELYLEGTLLLAKMENIGKRSYELIKGRTPDEFAKEATEDEISELMSLYLLKKECETEYRTWKKKKDEYKEKSV